MRPFTPCVAQPYQSVVLDSVRDGDTSVKKRALDLIFALVDERNAGEVRNLCPHTSHTTTSTQLPQYRPHRFSCV